MTRWLCTRHRFAPHPNRSIPTAGIGEPCCPVAIECIGGADLSTWYQTRLQMKEPDIRNAIYDWRNLRTRDDQWRAIRLHAWRAGRVWRELE